jgi:hypothetical protein
MQQTRFVVPTLSALKKFAKDGADGVYLMSGTFKTHAKLCT